MKNKIAEEALGVLQREINRVTDNSVRQLGLEQLKGLRAYFDLLEKTKAPVDNPPGKAVIRDEEGKVTGLQG